MGTVKLLALIAVSIHDKFATEYFVDVELEP